MITKSFGYSDPFKMKRPTIDPDLWAEYKKNNSLSIFSSTNRNKESAEKSNEGPDRELSKGLSGHNPDSNIVHLEPVKYIKFAWAKWIKQWPKWL